jgi:hypothetical protein
MPDIQKGPVEITKYEAKDLRNLDLDTQSGQHADRHEQTTDELGEVHDESAYTHLGRS